MKEFLSQKGLAHTVKEVDQDQEAMNELMKLGFRSTPVTLVDGKPIVGFNPKVLEQTLG